MNIYVDKFPESCECCPCNDDYYRCGLSGDLFDLHCIYKRRMKNCKLKQLADVVEADKAQKEIDYWHDKAQSYEQTILKLSLNKADVVEVVRCKDCRWWRDIDHTCKYSFTSPMCANDYCSHGERADNE